MAHVDAAIMRNQNNYLANNIFVSWLHIWNGGVQFNFLFVYLAGNF